MKVERIEKLCDSTPKGSWIYESDKESISKDCTDIVCELMGIGVKPQNNIPEKMRRINRFIKDNFSFLK